jgi:hypothetical protein
MFYGRSLDYEPDVAARAGLILADIFGIIFVHSGTVLHHIALTGAVWVTSKFDGVVFQPIS